MKPITRIKLLLCLAFAAGVCLVWARDDGHFVASAQSGPSGPTHSSPIAVTPDDRFVWVANPDNDSVSVINVQNDANQKVAEIKVGDEPNGVAVHPNGQTVYVTNTISGTVSVINANTRNIVATILVGTEPYGLALTPNGTKLYVTNARSDDISVISTATNTVLRTIRLQAPVPCPSCPPCPTCPLFEPRGVAITSDGDGDDSDEKVYVTQFNAVDRPGTIIGADDYKEGRVLVISALSDSVVRTVVLAPMADTGFRSKGSALACKIKGAADPTCVTNAPDNSFTTGAFPNSLNAIAIKGNRAYLPNNAASPDGPFRFNVNVQAFLNVVDTVTDVEAKVGDRLQTINMNRGINFEPPSENKLFLGMPWHIAFEPNSQEGWVVAMGANRIVKVVLDGQGTPTINAPQAAGDPGNIIRIKTGQKPIGIAINSTGTRGYVANEVSRDVTVVNLDANQVLATVSSTALPQTGTLEATVQYGKGIFFSSAEVNLPTLGPFVPAGRLSSEGWSGCVSCHAFGLTDQVVWIFGTGPRRSLPFNGSFNPHNPNDQKIFNYSGVNDEIQDFENNIRDTQGGAGVIIGTPNAGLAAPNARRSVELDALKEFIARGIRSPISPYRGVPRFSRLGQEIERGRELFEQAGCVTCHAGGGWSSARLDYTPPPLATDVVRAQIIRLLRPVGTFNAANVNEIRQNGAAPLGADGFAPPSLLGAWALGPLFHNGSALTIDDVLENVTHRRAGLRLFEPDPLNDEVNRRYLVQFLKSIDAATPPFTTSPF
jgi:YVTN family beta-propeller protein